MGIQFSGLSSGLDTATIVKEMMALERAPITRMSTEKTWHSSRLQAFTELDSRLRAFSDAIKDLNYSSTLNKRTVGQSTSDFLTATVGADALAGTSYQVEVVALAQVQKSISATGVADKQATQFGGGELRLTIDGEEHGISLEGAENSLEDVAKAINKAGLGVSASIINDGSNTPYRLVLTGQKTAQTFSLDASGLAGGEGLGGFTTAQTAQKAHVRVDGIDIYSASNTIAEGIPGVKLDLLQAKEGTTTNLSVTQDSKAIKASIESFVKAYNDILSFIGGQSVTTAENGEQKGGGVLGGDAGVNSVKRQLQRMLTQSVPNAGAFTTLSQLGLETQKDGTLKINSDTLTKAIDNNMSDIVNLFTDSGEQQGIISQYKDYLFKITSSATGLLQGRKTSINASIKRIDSRIESMELRLEKRQSNLEKQFSAMESLMSGFNAQSSYLTQQMNMLNNMLTNK
ncbi:flagellar filament capping protein FliD [Desulfobulbus sp.]|uniref:flagellar filament capping protein FliD n=1 Tax=Desulfobulbus sp. TaxID=895 RepID=UPI00286F49ED|nr:flagellar filament capping protein FliD [Desulfobulbus sp.]